MGHDEDVKKRVARKLTKRKKEGHQSTVKMPSHLEEGEDVEDDCTALHGMNSYVNQSVFGMIAAAGSQADFNARFDGASSDDEEETAAPSPASTGSQVGKQRKDKATGKSEEKKSHRRLSGHNLLRSLPRLGTKHKSKDKQSGSPVPESPSDTSSLTTHNASSRDAPVMSRMLEAKAELEMRPSFDMQRQGYDGKTEDNGGPSTSSLAKRLMEIFNFDQPEKVIEEYPCWLLKSVLLQGYMYITTKHVCFYAYLPKKSVSPTYSSASDLTDSFFLERGCQVGLPSEIRPSKSQIQSVLVPPQGRCPLIL